MQRQLYETLMQNVDVTHCDGFDAHVVASGVAVAAGEDPATLLTGTGLTRPLFLELAHDIFPSLAATFAHILPSDVALAPSPDQVSLCELLSRDSNGTRVSLAIAALVARRALEPNHLWQDLGLRNRRELSWLMERHFPRLASKNRSDMKWKKFLYRTICRDEGFGLCVAPVCTECTDYAHCFGEESGAQLLVHSTPA